ncbi:hypothetical protein JTE90_006577 [Oedothorax gibbosus]|uniref:Non-structural maintenance of chromosomes element 1 homolog n=1 Tax=Oedothorax gibbosus TaxID=931172 RepID=A0AAV6VLA6_9ARAC|nr:hypothetical protein JTE90_006577 [Oedothorax gibbosus]
MGELQLQHQMFLQAFMWKKVCDSEEVRMLHTKCHDSVNVPEGDLKIFIEKINCALQPLSMNIKKGIDELTAKQCYVLVNIADTPISRLSSEYESLDLELFKKIVSSIVESEEGKISSTTVLNFADDINKTLTKKVSRRDVNDILKKFIESGWLCEQRGYVFFSTRAIFELQHFFKENFPNSITTCVWCKNIVFQGASCISCGKKVHIYCREHYVERTGNRLCHACNSNFCDD